MPRSSSLSLIERKHADAVIQQRAGDGYVNATAMCQAAGKLFGDYARLDATKAFLRALEAETGYPITELIQSLRGGRPELQGTWIHPKVAIHLAQWLSPEFAVQVTNWVFDWMSAGRVAPTPHRFDPWFERISLNYDSAPPGYFNIFKETNQIIFELISAGLEVDENLIPDISIGQHWSKHWLESRFDEVHGERRHGPHWYPDRFPQAKSNPQDLWCYPDSALGEFRRWLRDVYLGAGKFSAYIKGKVSQGKVLPSTGRLAITAVGSRKQLH
jgi:KilA-N domain